MSEGDIVAKFTQTLTAASFPCPLSALAELAGLKVGTRQFETKVWQAIEAFRAETGRQVVKKNGMLELLDPIEQLGDAKKKSEQSVRKRARSISVAQGVRPGEVADPDAARSLERRRTRFLDREEGRMAVDSFTVVALTQDQIKAIAERVHVVKREKRPRSQ